MQEALSTRVRFGAFELDLKTGELLRRGKRIMLQEQPYQILRMLVERAPDSVTREEIKRKLWPNDTIVEFDHSINTVIKNLRRALGDSADAPKYIETLARRGYRLMVPVEQLSVAGGQLSEASARSADAPPLSPSFGDRVGMTLTGRTVSHYRVLDIIGGGGMGVVYRAEDFKLGRQVALKFLPEELGSEPQALERFSREARAASSLDHPNICPIHEFGEHEGRPFIVMQLLEGQTLRDRLAKEERALPLAELLDIGIQVSEGLQAAHEKGIIHRDIKPANIFLTSKGTVKILDFGLAKLMEAPTVEAPGYSPATAEHDLKGHGFSRADDGSLPLSSRAERVPQGGTSEVEGPAFAAALENAGPSTPCRPDPQGMRVGEEGRHSAQDDNSKVDDGTPFDKLRAGSEGVPLQNLAAAEAAPLHSATPPDPALTRTGVAMGTAGYMSPEQVRGEKLDARTDIFSFGLVLYEMATGQRAFTGETEAIQHDAILHKPPVPVRELNSTLPARLVTTINKCLAKESERRYQSAGELRTALEKVRRVAAPPPAKRRLRRLTVASLAVLLAAASAVGIWWWRRPLAQRAFQKYSVTPLTSTGNVAFAALSPDGKYLAYADDEIGKQSIWVQQLATSTTVRILGPVSSYLGRGLRFTPDGNYLYYSRQDPGGSRFSLYRLAVLGGSPEKILTNVWSSDTTWSGTVDLSPDGEKIVFARYTDEGSYLLTANADGSGERRILTLPAKEHMVRLAWAPDGQMIAFTINEGGTASTNCVAVISSQGERERRILRNVRAIHGIAWLPDQSGLVITAFGPGTENSALWIVSYPEGNLRRVTADVADYFGVSLVHGAGRLVTVQQKRDSSLWVASALSPSEATQLREGAGNKDGTTGVDWLGDGRLVYGSGGYSGGEVWLVDRDGGHRLQLTHTHGEAEGPSAKGATIVFTYGPNIWMINADGSNLKRITSDSIDKLGPEISPDGKWFSYDTMEGPWKKSLAGGEPTQLDPNGVYPTISPDGRWIAFEEGRQHKIKIVASDGKAPPRLLPFITEPQIPESANMGSLPIRWTADGKAITYVRTQNGVSNIWAQPIDGSPARQLTNFTSMLIWRHAWSPDGKYLVMARGNFARDAVMLTDLR